MANISKIKLPDGNTHNIVDKTSGYTKLTIGTTATTAAAGNHTHSYLPLSGGTLTGNISFNMSGTTRTPLKIYGGDVNGQGISVGDGAATIVGAGESAKACESLLGATTEQLWLTSDNDIRFYTNCQTIGNKVGVILNTSRQFYPDTNNTGSLGTSSNKWANVYATTFNGNLTGNVTGNVTGNCSGSAGSVAWANVTGKPSTYAPTIGTTATTAAAGNHTHSYAGASSAGGVATSAYKISHSCTIDSANKSAYPWHRIMSTNSLTATYRDTDAIIMINHTYIGGGLGIAKISLRGNNTSNPTLSIKWLVRNDLAADSLVGGLYLGSSGAGYYADIYYKVGTYARCRLYEVTYISAWNFISSNETTDSASHIECYESVSAGATAVRGKAYSSTVTASDFGQVSYANSAGSVAWGNVTGKPSTYAPTIGTTATTAAAGNHTHSYLPLSGGTLTGLLNANGNISIKGSTTSSGAFDSTNPKIQFMNSDGNQACQLVFTDYDSYQAPASLTLAGQAGEEAVYFIAPNIKATSNFYAGNAINSTVNTSTYLNGNNGVAIISSSNKGYTMLARMASTNGVFTIGSYNDKFEMHYTAQSIIDAKTNTVSSTLVLLNEAGNSSFPGTVSGTFSGNLTGNVTGNCSGSAGTVGGYAASALWRSDGAVWNPGANVTLKATANNQEWSFDITRNGKTGCCWHVWDSAYGSLLKVNADDGVVSAPKGFSGSLTGNVTGNVTGNLTGTASWAADSHMVDGLHADAFFYNRGATGSARDTLWTKIGTRQFNGVLPDGMADNATYNYGQTLSFCTDNARFDIYCSDNSSTTSLDYGLWFRSGWNTTKRAWRKIMDDNTINYVKTWYCWNDTNNTPAISFATNPATDKAPNQVNWYSIGLSDWDAKVQGGKLLCLNNYYGIDIRTRTDAGIKLFYNGQYILTSDTSKLYAMPCKDDSPTWASALAFWQDCETRMSGANQCFVRGKVNFADFGPSTGSWIRAWVSAQNRLNQNQYDITGTVLITDGTNIWFTTVRGKNNAITATSALRLN